MSEGGPCKLLRPFAIRTSKSRLGLKEFLMGMPPTYFAPPEQFQMFQRSFSTREGRGRGIGSYSVKLLTEKYL